MKVIVNKYIPFHGYIAMSFYNIIFWREEYAYKLSDEDKYKQTVNHESIHEAQMRDFCKWLPIGGTIFYILYLFEWLYKVLFKYPFSHKAYKDISFEKEAKQNEDNLEYLNNRKRFAFYG